MTTPTFAIPTVTAGSINNDADLNTALGLVDGLLTPRVEDRDLTAPPGSPTNGAVYIVGASATGDWAGQDGNVAIYNEGWTFVSPIGGMQVFLHDEKALYCYSSVESLWFPVQPLWSTSEHWTGRYGAGGTKLYAKCWAGLTVQSGSGSTTQAHSITSLDIANSPSIWVGLEDGTDAYDGSQPITGSIRFYAKVDATNITLTSASMPSGFTANVRLEYERTA